MTIKSHQSIVTLKVNSLNGPIKEHRVADCIKRQGPPMCCLQKTHFEPTATSRLKAKRRRTIFHANRPQKKAKVAILRAEKLDFKLTTVVRNTEGH